MAENVATATTATVPSSDQNKHKNHLKLSSAIVQALNDQREIDLFADFTVVVDNKEFSSQRFILSACSGFFRGLFVSGMVENINRRVTIAGISKETFTLVLDCIYKGEDVLSLDNMIDIWHAANQLEISFLLKHCEDFVADNITVQNCFDVYENAKLLECKSIITLAWNTLLKEFNSIRCSKEILNFSLEEMKSLLASHYLNAMSEDHVVDLIMRWVSLDTSNEKSSLHDLAEKEDTTNRTVQQADCEIHSSRQGSGSVSEVQENSCCSCDGNAGLGDIAANLTPDQSPVIKPKQSQMSVDNLVNDNHLSTPDKELKIGHPRSAYLTELLSVSRYCLISGKAIENLLSTGIILGNDKAMSLIKESICCQVTRPKRHDCLAPGTIHRASSGLKNVITWLKFRQDSNSFVEMMCMNIANEKVTTIGLNEIYRAIDSVVYNDHIYIVDTMFCYDYFFQRNKLISKTTFSSRSGHAVASVGEYVYVVGGGSLLVERMSTSFEDSWNSVGTLAVDITNTTAAVIGANIILFGSSEKHYDTTVIQCFNTETLTSNRLDDIDDPPQRIMIFRKADQTFVLFRTGALYKLEVSEMDVISIRHMMMLWDYDRNLNGAILCRDQLYLFDDKFANEGDPGCHISLPGVFESIKNLSQKGFAFQSTVVPKKFCPDE